MCLDAEGMWCAENIALTLGEAGAGCQARSRSGLPRVADLIMAVCRTGHGFGAVLPVRKAGFSGVNLYPGRTRRHFADDRRMRKTFLPEDGQHFIDRCRIAGHQQAARGLRIAE